MLNLNKLLSIFTFLVRQGGRGKGLSRSQSLTGNAITEALPKSVVEGRAFWSSFPYRVWEREEKCSI
jgi:hypothetical protein